MKNIFSQIQLPLIYYEQELRRIKALGQAFWYYRLIDIVIIWQVSWQTDRQKTKFMQIYFTCYPGGCRLFQIIVN